MNNRPWRTRFNIFMDSFGLELSIIRHKLADKKLLSAFFRLVLVVFLVFLLGGVISYFYLNPGKLESLVESAKIFGPFIIIGLIVLEVIVAPVPGTFIMVASGAMFGTWLGALYSYIGNVLGSIVAFFLSRHFGRPFAERIVSRKLLLRYDKFFMDRKDLLVVFYMLPIIPVDILSFVCGLSSLRWRKFFLIVVFGFIPNTLLLAFLGDLLSKLTFLEMTFYILLFLAVFALLTWLFRLMVKKFNERRSEKDF